MTLIYFNIFLRSVALERQFSVKLEDDILGSSPGRCAMAGVDFGQRRDRHY
ncbi:MAG: hypothetical protein WBL95_01545 [Microcoleus sp.]